MQSDNRFQQNKMEYVVEEFANAFGENMRLLDKPEKIGPMDAFVLCYEYLPLKYKIKFDTERKFFTILILNGENEFVSLGEIEKYDSELTPEKVRAAIIQLKGILQKNNFCFSIIRGKHVYKKSGEDYKRIKNF